MPSARSSRLVLTRLDGPVVSGLFRCTDKLLLTDQMARQPLKEFVRKNAANALSVANMVMGMASILSSLNG